MLHVYSVYVTIFPIALLPWLIERIERIRRRRICFSVALVIPAASSPSPPVIVHVSPLWSAGASRPTAPAGAVVPDHDGYGLQSRGGHDLDWAVGARVGAAVGAGAVAPATIAAVAAVVAVVTV